MNTAYDIDKLSMMYCRDIYNIFISVMNSLSIELEGGDFRKRLRRFHKFIQTKELIYMDVYDGILEYQYQRNDYLSFLALGDDTVMLEITYPDGSLGYMSYRGLFDSKTTSVTLYAGKGAPKVKEMIDIRIGTKTGHYAAYYGNNSSVYIPGTELEMFKGSCMLDLMRDEAFTMMMDQSIVPRLQR